MEIRNRTNPCFRGHMMIKMDASLVGTDAEQRILSICKQLPVTGDSISIRGTDVGKVIFMHTEGPQARRYKDLGVLRRIRELGESWKLGEKLETFWSRSDTTKAYQRQKEAWRNYHTPLELK